MSAMFHLQTTEILPLKVECFFTKMLRSQQYEVIIYDVSADFGYVLAVKNSIIMSFSCAKLHHDRLAGKLGVGEWEWGMGSGE